MALFNKKIKLFVKGRQETFGRLSVIKPTDKVVWLHAASLGEFEQGRPILENIKANHPDYKIVITFFSPSGYEIRKNVELTTVVCYLPFDTSKKVARFIKQLHPDLAIIVKYEFWPNLLYELKNNKIQTILVSGIFRKDHLFFKPYGQWMQPYLTAFQHIFVQNEISKNLLHSIGLHHVTVSGDTRFDRVYTILKQDNSLEFVEQFKNGCYTVVAGSTWPEVDALWIDYINEQASEDEKFIIAPHNIRPKHINTLCTAITKKTALFSSKEHTNLKDCQVLIIDTIGILTKIYLYADVAYVGGGFQTGLHNILEPATFGVPIVFGGHHYHKFQEAIDLLELGGCKTVENQDEFYSIFALLRQNNTMRENMGTLNKQYVENNIGATDLICNYINTII